MPENKASPCQQQIIRDLVISKSGKFNFENPLFTHYLYLNLNLEFEVPALDKFYPDAQAWVC